MSTQIAGSVWILPCTGKRPSSRSPSVTSLARASLRELPLCSTTLSLRRPSRQTPNWMFCGQPLAQLSGLLPTPGSADERVSNDALNEAVLWRAGHLTFGRCDRHWPFRLTPAASGHERLRGVPQSVRQAFSPVLAVDEQGDDLVDAPLAGVGAIGCIDVFNLTPLHAFITRYRPGFRHHTPARPYRTSPHRTARTYGSSARPAVAASGQRGSQMTSGMSRSVQRW